MINISNGKNFISKVSHRNDLKKQHRSPSHLHHEVVFAINQRNTDQLEELLNKISDPKNKNDFQKYKSFDEITELTKNEDSLQYVKQ